MRRHTFASLMIAAGVNAKALAVYVGHASVMVTFDLHGHLLPGNEAEAAGSWTRSSARAYGTTWSALGARRSSWLNDRGPSG